jgi:hypothetical protein
MNRTNPTTYGLAICALLGVVDIVSLAGLGADDGPPAGVIVLGAVLGLITLVGARMAWRGERSGMLAVIVCRVISALTALPAFFVDDVPGGIRIATGVLVALTVLGVGLVVMGLRRWDPSPA